MELPPTLVFDYPSVAAITGLVTSMGAGDAGDAGDADDAPLLSDSDDGAAVTTVPTSPARRLRAAGATQLVAVSAFACRTAAGDAVLSLRGRDASRRVPFERWSVDDAAEVRA